MKKKIILLTILINIIFVSLGISYAFIGDKVLSSLITFGVISYHFLMRLFVGFAVGKMPINQSSRWFNEVKFEQKVYKLLKVKKLKKYVPTYDSNLFDINKNSLSQIYKNTCTAEVVHEVICVLSLLPLFLIIPFNEPLVFALTSVIALLVDLIFVVVQRYNRPRIKHLMELKRKTN